MEIKKLETEKIQIKSPIRSFEDLEVYKLAREFRKKIYRLTKKLPADEKFNLISQMRRAALSLTNNIAEGYGRYHYQENIQFCRQARGSLCELIDDLNACLDEEYIFTKEHPILHQEAEHLWKVLNGYIAKTQRLQRESIS